LDGDPIIAIGAVIYRCDRRGGLELLLIKKQRGLWTLPKGRVEPGEAFADALIREVREETGLSGQIEELVQQVRYDVFKRGLRRPKQVTYYLLRAASGQLRPGVAEGIQEVRWFPLEAALGHIGRDRVRAVAGRAAALLCERALGGRG
jgi:8-oxo-dGTP pyrophosphatase MutT (NUDIX family)